MSDSFRAEIEHIVMRINKWSDEDIATNAELLGKHFEQLEAENAKLKAELAATGWQSADKLPEEEGDYKLTMLMPQGHWENLSATYTLMGARDTIYKLICKGYKVKYLKLPDVEEK
jgi:hypothetical protein